MKKIDLSIFIFIFVSLGPIFLGAGALFQVIDNTNMVLDSPNWIERKALITSSEVESSYRNNQTIYTPEVDYQYVFKGKVYKGNRITLSVIAVVFKHRAIEVIRTYTKGSSVIILINPENPQQSVIVKPEMNWLPRLALGGISIFFIAIGGFLGYRLLKPKQLRSTPLMVEEMRRAPEPIISFREQDDGGDVPEKNVNIESVSELTKYNYVPENKKSKKTTV